VLVAVVGRADAAGDIVEIQEPLKVSDARLVRAVLVRDVDATLAELAAVAFASGDGFGGFPADVVLDVVRDEVLFDGAGV
jgi:hypothetical protein